jgi:PPP family 3-phenylpropionic acid transporter
MRLLRTQYFLTFAVLGTVLPYISVLFDRAGLSHLQIGYAFAIWSVAQILSPVLIAWAADSHIDPRRLVLLCSICSGGSLLGLSWVQGVWPVMSVWTFYCLASIPLLPLIDGIYFGFRRLAAEEGGPTPPAYHRVRVWGTIGYIVPSLFLFALLYAGVAVAVAAMTTGALLAALAGVQAMFLRDPRPAKRHTALQDSREERGGPGIPTAAAARVLFRANMLVLCAALFLGQMASTALAAFYPVYLTERVGMGLQWVGLVAQVGVVFEVFFVLGCGWFGRRIGTRGMLVAGFSGTALRLVLLAIAQDPITAVATQVLHGMLVVVLGVLPQPLLDRHASDNFRHSMQGLYVMLMGCGKMVGSLAAGALAEHSLQAVFGYGAALCAAAGALILFGFRDRPPATASQPIAVPVEAPVGLP